MENTEKLFKHLFEALEDNNEHDDSIILKALETHRYDLIKELCDIAIEHEKEGSISEELSIKRYAIYKNINK